MAHFAVGFRLERSCVRYNFNAQIYLLNAHTNICMFEKVRQFNNYTHTQHSYVRFFPLFHLPMRCPTGVEKTLPRAPTLKNDAILVH